MRPLCAALNGWALPQTRQSTGLDRHHQQDRPHGDRDPYRRDARPAPQRIVHACSSRALLQLLLSAAQETAEGNALPRLPRAPVAAGSEISRGDCFTRREKTSRAMGPGGPARCLRSAAVEQRMRPCIVAAGGGRRKMAPRPTWKGYLRLSLVSCPVRLYPATTRSERVSFHLLNPKTHNRIELRPHDPATDEEIPRDQLVRGYEFDKGRYAVMDDAEIEALRIDSSETIDLVRFVDDAEIDPIYFNTPYYIAPDGKIATETFAVIM